MDLLAVQETTTAMSVPNVMPPPAAFAELFITDVLLSSFQVEMWMTVLVAAY